MGRSGPATLVSLSIQLSEPTSTWKFAIPAMRVAPASRRCHKAADWVEPQHAATIPGLPGTHGTTAVRSCRNLLIQMELAVNNLSHLALADRAGSRRQNPRCASRLDSCPLPNGVVSSDRHRLWYLQRLGHRAVESHLVMTAFLANHSCSPVITTN